MSDMVTLALEDAVSEDVARDIAAALGDLSEVESARPLQRRGLDPATALVLVQIAGGILTAATSAWAIVEKIQATLRAKQVSNATITLPNGTKIELQSVTQEQIAALVAATK